MKAIEVFILFIVIVIIALILYAINSINVSGGWFSEDILEQPNKERIIRMRRHANEILKHMDIPFDDKAKIRIASVFPTTFTLEDSKIELNEDIDEIIAIRDYGVIPKVCNLLEEFGYTAILEKNSYGKLVDTDFHVMSLVYSRVVNLIDNPYVIQEAKKKLQETKDIESKWKTIDIEAYIKQKLPPPIVDVAKLEVSQALLDEFRKLFLEAQKRQIEIGGYIDNNKIGGIRYDGGSYDVLSEDFATSEIHLHTHPRDRPHSGADVMYICDPNYLVNTEIVITETAVWIAKRNENSSESNSISEYYDLIGNLFKEGKLGVDDYLKYANVIDMNMFKRYVGDKTPDEFFKIHGKHIIDMSYIG